MNEVEAGTQRAGVWKWIKNFLDEHDAFATYLKFLGGTTGIVVGAGLLIALLWWGFVAAPVVFWVVLGVFLIVGISLLAFAIHEGY